MRDEKGPLAATVAAVLDGRLSPGEARLLFDEQTDGPDEEWAAGRLEEVLELIGDIGAEQSVLRIPTMIELGERAAEPLGPRSQGVVLLMGSRRLDEHEALSRGHAYLDRAITCFEDSPDLRLKARRLRLRALRQAGRYEELDREVPDVVAEAERLGSNADLCMALAEKAEAAVERNRPDDAAETFRAARRIRQGALDDSAVPVTEAHRLAWRHGETARQAGRFEEALSALEDARTFALAADDPSYAAFALSETGITWGWLGDHERGRRILRQAADEAEKAGRPDLAAHWRGAPEAKTAGAGESDSEQSLWHRASALAKGPPERAAEAVPLLRAFVKKAREAHNSSYEAQARHHLAVAFAAVGQALQAELSFRSAITLAGRHGDHLSEVRYRNNLARMLLNIGRPSRALAELRPAIELGERLRERPVSVELRQSTALALAQAYDMAVLIAAAPFAPGTDAPGDSPAEAEQQPGTLLEIGQRARAATLTEALRVGRSVEEHGRAGLVDAMLRLRAAEAAVQLAAAEHRTLAGPIAERHRAAAALTRRAARSGVRLTVTSDPVPLEDLTASLTPGEVLLDLLAVPEGVAVTCLTGEGSASTVFAVWSAEKRRKLLRLLKRLRRESLGAHPDDRDEIRADTDRALATLDACLWSVVAELVGTVRVRPPERILIVPDNELFQLPYWRLASRFPGCALSVLPSPGALPLLRARPRHGGRPWFSVPDPSRSLRHAARDIPDELGYETCAPRADALRASLPAAGRVHFACHGHFDAVSAYRSGLEVTADVDRDPLGALLPHAVDGLELFTAAQITGRLHLPHCALVVLAACDSGLPRLHGASEFTSLPGAFLVAGARNVVASLWPAHDGAAALLMNAFYLAEHGRPSAALAAARTRLATMSRAEAADRLGASGLPHGDPPFADSVYTDCFQHYGVD